MTAEQLLTGWTPKRVGRHIIAVAETPSTNTLALQSVTTLGGPDGRDADGLVVVADFQTAGRGRLGRHWLSPRAASVLCSVIVVPTNQEMDIAGASPSATPFPGADSSSQHPGPSATTQFSGHLILVSSVAACEAVRQSTEITPAIKWPNDLRAGRRKLGGILIESRPIGHGRRAWVIGIGVNCLQHPGHFPPELRALATSLEIEASGPIDRVEVARSLLQRLDHWLAQPTAHRGHRDPRESVRDEWERYAEPIGQRVRLRSRGHDYAGTTIAVDPVGGLIIQTDTGKQEWFGPLQTTLLWP